MSKSIVNQNYPINRLKEDSLSQPAIKQACRTINRLEDLIDLAKGGEKINLKIALRKEVILPKESSDKPYYLKVDRDMYLLIADFLFGTGSETVTISKVYALGCVTEAITDEQVNKSVANERLKMDYERLKKAGIKPEEKLF